MPSSTHRSVVSAVGRTLRLGLGSAVLSAGSGGRIIGGQAGLHTPGDPLPAEPWIDFAVGLADISLLAVERTATFAADALAPAARVLSVPLNAARGQLQNVLEPLVQPITERGRQRRLQSEQESSALAEALFPVATEVLVRNVDLLRILQLSLESVDVASTLDLIDLNHAMAATAERFDFTDFAIQHVDMTRVLEAAMRSVDVAAVLRVQLENVELSDLINTPTNLAGEALRTTGRLVGGAAERGRRVRSMGAAALESGRAAAISPAPGAEPSA